MKTVKQILGITILLVLGFILFCILSGIGALIYLVIHVLAAWQLVVGTALGALIIFIYLLEKLDDK